MPTTIIYVLTDPRTLEPRYVGYSKNLKVRYMTHISESQETISECWSWSFTTPKHYWIRDLLTLGLKPILEIVAVVPGKDRNYWEAFFCEVYKEYDLLNRKIVSKSYYHRDRGYSN